MVKLRKIIIFIYVVVVALGPLAMAPPARSADTGSAGPVGPTGLQAEWVDSQTIRVYNIAKWSTFAGAKWYGWAGSAIKSNGKIEAQNSDGSADFKYSEIVKTQVKPVDGGSLTRNLAIYRYRTASGCVNSIWIGWWADGGGYGVNQGTFGGWRNNIDAKFNTLNLPSRWINKEGVSYVEDGKLQDDRIDEYTGGDPQQGQAYFIPNPLVDNNCWYSGAYPNKNGTKGAGDQEYISALDETPHVALSASKTNSLVSAFYDTDKDVVWHPWGKAWGGHIKFIRNINEQSKVSFVIDPKQATNAKTYNSSCGTRGDKQTHIDFASDPKGKNAVMRGDFWIFTAWGDTPKCEDVLFHIFLKPLPHAKILEVLKEYKISYDSENQLDEPDGCYADVKVFRYIFCPMILTANAVAESMGNSVKGLLSVSPLAKGSKIKPVWEQMRNLANVFFVLVFLVIIFSNIFSFGLSNYSIKKTLPRLVVAAILVQFSFLICGIAVDIGNVAGEGVASLIAVKIQAPSGSMVPGLFSYTIGTITAGLAVGVVLAASLPMALFAVFAAILSIIGVIITLLFRRFFIILLIVLSPIAFLAWILPGTQNIFKKFWLNNFIKLILMYPLIALILGMGSLVQAAALAGDDTLAQLAASLYPTIALFMVPATFKMSGGIMSKASGAINGKFKSWGKSTKNSQLAKDLKKSYRDKQTLNAKRGITAFGKTVPGGKLIGRLGSGNFLPTAAGRKRFEIAAEQAAKSRRESEAAAMANLDSREIMGRYASLSEDGKAAAINLLASKGGWKELADIKAAMPAGSEVDDRIWKAGTKEKFGDIIQKAPDLVLGASTFEGITADKLVGYHPSTILRLNQAAANNKELKKRVSSALNGVANSSNLKSKMDTTSARYLRNGIVKVEKVKGQDQEIGGPIYGAGLESQIDSDGFIK